MNTNNPKYLSQSEPVYSSEQNITTVRDVRADGKVDVYRRTGYFQDRNNFFSGNHSHHVYDYSGADGGEPGDLSYIRQENEPHNHPTFDLWVEEDKKWWQNVSKKPITPILPSQSNYVPMDIPKPLSQRELNNAVDDLKKKVELQETLRTTEKMLRDYNQVISRFGTDFKPPKIDFGKKK